MARFDYCQAKSLVNDDRVTAVVDALRNINRSTLAGLTTLYSIVDDERRRSGGRPSVHGCGFILEDDVWLTVSGCWSGKWQLRVLVGSGPFGFGAEGIEVAQLELSKPKYDKAVSMLHAPWNKVDKATLLAKHGHKFLAAK